jgi:hypothetical protein
MAVRPVTPHHQVSRGGVPELAVALAKSCPADARSTSFSTDHDRDGDHGLCGWFMAIAHALAPRPRTRTAGPGVRTWKEIFLGLLGETFVVVSEDRKKRVRMKLFDVYDIYETAETEQFSLVFRAPLGVKLAKGMYSIRHRQVGKTALYLQPSGADEFNRYYEASPFNLLP